MNFFKIFRKSDLDKEMSVRFCDDMDPTYDLEQSRRNPTKTSEPRFTCQVAVKTEVVMMVVLLD